MEWYIDEEKFVKQCMICRIFYGLMNSPIRDGFIVAAGGALTEDDLVTLRNCCFRT